MTQHRDTEGAEVWPAPDLGTSQLGEWLDEPNEEAWFCDVTGFAMAIRRHPEMLHLCGYVGVPESHPACTYADYEDVPVSIHGGLTYRESCPPGGTPDGRVWFGFDCAHGGDLVPIMYARFLETEGRYEYRNWAWVRNEVARMAVQLALMDEDSR